MTQLNNTESTSEAQPLSVAELSQGRSHIYLWFSQQYQAELTEAQWHALVEGELSPFFTLLAENGLAKEVHDYTEAVAQLHEKSGKQARLILASDFAHAFLLSGRDSAMPYASAYDPDAEGLLYGAMAEIMREFLAQAELGVAKAFKEPEDHLSVYLALLSHMAAAVTNDNAAAAFEEQALFIEQALNPWLDEFVAKCQTVSLQSEVYPALARLLAAFVAQDQRYLSAYTTAAAE